MCQGNRPSFFFRHVKTEDFCSWVFILVHRLYSDKQYIFFDFMLWIPNQLLKNTIHYTWATSAVRNFTKLIKGGNHDDAVGFAFFCRFWDQGHRSSNKPIVYPYEYYIYLCNESCSVRRPAVLRGKKLLTLDIALKFSNNLLFTCHAYRHHWSTTLYHFHWPWLWLGLQSQRRKPIGFIFSCICQLFRMKFDMLLKQLKLNTLVFNDIMEIPAVLLTARKTNNQNNFDVSMHSDGYELIWFKLVMIYTIELYISILV